jgi:serine/threonine protein kinase
MASPTLNGDFLKHAGAVESDLCKMLDPSYSETNQLISKFKRENMGYIRYLAPENVYSDNEFSSKEGDMWALGVVLYELITGHLPSFLQSETDDRVMQNLEKFLTNEVFSNQF